MRSSSSRPSSKSPVPLHLLQLLLELVAAAEREEGDRVRRHIAQELRLERLDLSLRLGFGTAGADEPEAAALCCQCGGEELRLLVCRQLKRAQPGHAALQSLDDALPSRIDMDECLVGKLRERVLEDRVVGQLLARRRLLLEAIDLLLRVREDEPAVHAPRRGACPGRCSFPFSIIRRNASASFGFVSATTFDPSSARSSQTRSISSPRAGSMSCS